MASEEIYLKKLVLAYTKRLEIDFLNEISKIVIVGLGLF